MTKRECFGTKEFYPENQICKGCEDYEACKEIAPKRKPKSTQTGKGLFERYRKGEI